MDSRIRIVDDDVCQTLNERMGTGGGNVPIILVYINGEDVWKSIKMLTDLGTDTR